MPALWKLWFALPQQETINVKCPNAMATMHYTDFDSDEHVATLKRRYVVADVVSLPENEKAVPFVEELVDESPLDRMIRKAVRFTGTIYMFVFMWVILLAWIVWGALTGGPDQWQIVMQDGQSIQTYVWDTLLMRQQLDDSKGFLKTFGKLKSRSLTHKRLLRKLSSNDRYRMMNLNENVNTLNFRSLTWFDKLSNFASSILGSLPAVVIYWMGIFIWIGFGAKPLINDEGIAQTWSDKWQMFINTGTAVELLITSVFLENIRSRNNDYMRDQLDIFAEFDSKLELISRLILDGDEMENPIINVKPCPRSKIQKWISKYSDIIGTGIGLVISVIVFAVWLGIGPIMKWNDNWWLIIGTYTGLVGFIDNVCLREVFYSITNYEEDKYLDLLQDSQELLDLSGINTELTVPKQKKGIINRISIRINEICSTEWAVVSAVAFVVLLLSISSALHWSTTGQLISNTPTMIIEGFFLLILIQAHNWADDSRSEILKELTKSRRLLYNYVIAYIPESEIKEY